MTAATEQPASPGTQQSPESSGRAGALRRLPRLVRLALAALLAAALLAVGVVGGSWLWVRRAAADAVHTVSAAPAAPVGLVLGAGLTGPGEPTPFLAARLDVAAQLYRSGAIKVILVSGDNRTADYNEPDAMRSYLVARRGVPAAAVVADYAGRDTYDSCVRARRIFGVEQALVISQGYHVPRAVAICRAVGLDARGVGDWSMELYGDVWRSGEQRELLANVKAVVDVLTARDPVLGAVEPGVNDALNRTAYP